MEHHHTDDNDEPQMERASSHLTRTNTLPAASDDTLHRKWSPRPLSLADQLRILDAEYDSSAVFSVMMQRWLNEIPWNGTIRLNADLSRILNDDGLSRRRCNETNFDPQFNGAASDVATYGDVDDTEDIGSQQLETPERSHFQRSPERQRKSFVLPITIGQGSEAVEIKACPDSGSDDNFISLDLAKRLAVGWVLDSRRTHFRMANGKTVEAVGTISASCCFAGQFPEKILTMDCIFHVFATLAVPVIMGLKFLLATETLTKHRGRLVEELIPPRQALRVNCVDTPKRHFLCCIDNTYVGKACADTGSDLNLMSLDFAETRMHSLKRRPADELVEFADGSIGYVTGVITTTFCVGLGWDLAGEHLCARSNASQVTLDFYVLEGLTTNVIIGQDSLLELDVFNVHKEYIFHDDQVPSDAPLNIIRHVGRLERAAFKAATKLRDIFKRKAPESYGKQHFADANYDTLLEELLVADQQENYRREVEMARIVSLSGGVDRAKALEEEDARATEYMVYRRQIELAMLQILARPCTKEPYLPQLILDGNPP